MKHVFVSSTFKDMQFERDALHNYVAVSINDKISHYGEQVYFGDLRWGVNTTSLDSDEGSRRVLEVCLDEIDDCRPYMIVLVGERYGWIPDPSLIRNAAADKGFDISEEMSVTQLEIEYGAFLTDEYKGRVFFYFRELDTTGMTDEQLADYLAESELHGSKINALKEKIRRLAPDFVRTYTAKFDPESQRVEGLSELLEMVERDLSGAILADIEGEEQLPWQERAIRSAQRYFLDISRNYYPAEHSPISLFDGVNSSERTRMCFIKGDSGTGKTAFLAHNYRQICERGDSCRCIPFVLGLDKYSSCEMDYFKILLYMLEKLSGEDEHRETSYGDPEYDQEIFDDIIFLECEIEGSLYSFIDNCSYELQNALSVRILDEYLRFCKIEYLASDVCSCEHLDFTIAYSADEDSVILPPWFDYSRTYVLDDISDDERIPIIKTLLAQKHKELDDSVIGEISEKEEANSLLYLKLTVDRLLMLDSTDFTRIRSMGDGMDNINRYQISLVKELPEDTFGMTLELVERVARRVNTELVLRVIGLLTYGGVRMNENDIKEIFLANAWEFSSLDFALATRSLSAVIGYNPKDKSYAVTGAVTVSALESLLADKCCLYVAKALCDYVISEKGSTHKKMLLRAASYLDKDYLAELYVENKTDKSYLADETNWIIKRHGAEFTAELLLNLVDKCPDHDFSFIPLGIPTSCLTFDDYDLYETLLQTVLDRFGELSNNEADINRNSFTVIAWTKAVSMKMKVNTSDASEIFHSFIDAGYRFYPMTARARIQLDVIYYRYLSLEAYYSMSLVDPESDTPMAEALIEELESSEEQVLMGAHLFASFAAYLKRGFDPLFEEYHSYARRGYEVLSEYLKDGDFDFFTADDIAMMIDCMLDKKDEYLHADVDSVENALNYMKMGQTYINSRLLKCLPRILEAAKYVFEDNESQLESETVSLMRRLCAASRAVAGSSLTVDDFLYATVQMSNCYDMLSDNLSPEEHIELITHLDKFVNFTLSGSDGDPRVFYRCYLAIRQLFTIFEIYEFEDAKASLLEKMYSIEVVDENAPLMPELFIGALIYRFGENGNTELCDRLHSIYETVVQGPEYSAYADAYSPELLYLKLDIRTPEEIEEDEAFEYGLFDDGESDYDDDGDCDEDDGYEEYDDDSEGSDGEEEFSVDDMIAFLEEMGLSLDDILADDEDEDGE